MNLVVWCDRVIRCGFYLLFGLVPILLTPWNYELFEFNKMMAVYALTVVITGAWAVKSIEQREFRIARTPLDIPILLFLSSQLLSSLFSIDPHVSWFGYYSRFNGGMLSIISYVLLYYAYVSNASDESHGSQLIKLLKIALATGVVVALYGVAERLGIDRHLWVQDVQNRVFSSLGQPNWLAAYLVALSPLAWGFALKSQIPSTKSQTNLKHQAQKITQNRLNIWNLNIVWSLEFVIWCLVSSLFFLVLLFTRSRSGLFAFAVADVVFWGLVLLRFSVIPGLTRNPAIMKDGSRLGGRDDKYKMFFPFIIYHVLFALIVFMNGTYIDSIDRWMTLEGWKTRILQSVNSGNPRDSRNLDVATPSASYTPPLLETGGTESGTIRKYVWQGAINAWRSSTKTYLIGTGTETFASAFYQYRPKEHNLTSEWDFLYNKAHNEYLNYLATTGVFGLGSYLLLIGAFIVWFVSGIMRHVSRKTNDMTHDTLTLDTALFSGWLSILITNFFGFSVVIVQVFLFLFPALVFSHYPVSNHKAIQQAVLSLRVPRWSSWLVVLLLVVLVGFVGATWYADTLYATGYRASRAGQYDLAVAKLSQALTFNPLEPLFADELGNAYAGFAATAIEVKDATRAAQFVRLSLASSDRAITTSPNNVNFWKTRTKIYYTFSSFDPAFNDASITALEQAHKLSPNDPKITYNLSILYGRKGDNNKAIELLKFSIILKPNYRDAYYALWVFYTEVRKTDLARQTAEEYLKKVDPGDKEFLSKLNN